MARKLYTAEEIIRQLRTTEVELAKGLEVVEACHKLRITEQIIHVTKAGRNTGKLSDPSIRFSF